MRASVAGLLKIEPPKGCQEGWFKVSARVVAEGIKSWVQEVFGKLAPNVISLFNSATHYSNCKFSVEKSIENKGYVFLAGHCNVPECTAQIHLSGTGMKQETPKLIKAAHSLIEILTSIPRNFLVRVLLIQDEAALASIDDFHTNFIRNFILTSSLTRDPMPSIILRHEPPIKLFLWEFVDRNLDKELPLKAKIDLLRISTYAENKDLRRISSRGARIDIDMINAFGFLSKPISATKSIIASPLSRGVKSILVFLECCSSNPSILHLEGILALFEEIIPISLALFTKFDPLVLCATLCDSLYRNGLYDHVLNAEKESVSRNLILSVWNVFFKLMHSVGARVAGDRNFCRARASSRPTS